MNILLDTHILLWHITDNSRLGLEQSRIIENELHAKFFSYASLWEIAIKCNLGKLVIHQPLERLVPAEITLLPIQIAHFKIVQTLPIHHRDPFDRLLIAQSIAENLMIMTDDGNFRQYEVPLL